VTDFASCFDDFRSTAFRLETLQRYDVPAEADRIAAWREHRPMPERSPRTNPFLARIAETTAAGKQWSRVHVLDLPLSEYVRFELETYRESARAGERIWLVGRTAAPGLAYLDRDFWLFDAGTRHAVAALMEYDQDGRYLDASVTTDEAVITACTAARDLALQHAVPLERYLSKEAQVA
jgi:hypothetical protein